MNLYRLSKIKLLLLYLAAGCRQEVIVEPLVEPTHDVQIENGDEKSAYATRIQAPGPVIVAKKDTFIKFSDLPIQSSSLPPKKKCLIDAGSKWKIENVLNPLESVSGHIKAKLKRAETMTSKTSSIEKSCENRIGWIYVADWDGDLGSNSCCSFPFQKPTNKVCENAGGGSGAFDASRSGRRHAACDLYALEGTPIYAIDDGIVIQDSYEFYCSTDALEVRHPNRIVRYGEIKPSSAKRLGMRAGTKVKKGQQIGTVGWLSCYDQPMLHFELFSGTASGPLTDLDESKYNRRKDLLNPTTFIKKTDFFSTEALKNEKQITFPVFYYYLSHCWALVCNKTKKTC